MSIISRNIYSKLSGNSEFRREFFKDNILKLEILIAKFKIGRPGKLLPSLILEICETDLKIETVISVDCEYNSIIDEKFRNSWEPFMGWNFYTKFRKNTQPIDLGTMEDIIESFSDLPQLLHKIYKRLKLVFTLEQISIKKSNYAEERILFLEKELQGKNNLLRVTTNKFLTLRKKTRLKLGDIPDEKLEELADQCRFKNNNLNFTKLGKKFYVDPDTVKNEIIRRNMSWLIDGNAYIKRNIKYEKCESCDKSKLVEEKCPYCHPQ